jgi:hypothetical protein
MSSVPCYLRKRGQRGGCCVDAAQRFLGTRNIANHHAGMRVAPNGIKRKEMRVAQSSQEHMARLVEALQQDPGLVEGLPSQEGQIARDALAGLSVYEIAQQHSVSERSVWDVLSNAARAASGRGTEQVEIGSANVGIDTDYGVTGNYGETGLGPVGEEPPETPV